MLDKEILDNLNKKQIQREISDIIVNITNIKMTINNLNNIKSSFTSEKETINYITKVKKDLEEIIFKENSKLEYLKIKQLEK